MIDLTPLDVRNKRGDFKKIMRGYDPQEVDIFLEIAADRLEALVRENIQLRERTQTLQTQVDAQAGREQAVQDALVTAQELRAEMQNHAQREADHIIKEAEVEARQLLAEADTEVRNRLRGVERRLDQGQHSLDDLERRRGRFLKEFRGLLEREMDVVSVEEGRAPLEDRAIDLDLGASRAQTLEEAVEPEVVEAVAAEDTPAEAVAEESPEAAGATPMPIAMAAPVAASIDVTPASADVGASDDAHGMAGSAAGEEHIPEVDVSAVLADMEAPADTFGASEAAPEPDVPDAVARVETVDVTDLQPEAPSAPPPDIAPKPSTLELELMAGAEHASSQAAPQAETGRYSDVPDLETVLAEAGVEEVRPPSEDEISPPPAPGAPRDNLLMFDPDDDEAKY